MLLERVEELFVDIRNELRSDLNGLCIILSLLLEMHWLIANQRQGHIKGACQEDHRAEKRV